MCKSNNTLHSLASYTVISLLSVNPIMQMEKNSDKKPIVPHIVLEDEPSSDVHKNLMESFQIFISKFKIGKKDEGTCNKVNVVHKNHHLIIYGNNMSKGILICMLK
uniref:Uncharacterized protein n=1 Tax=Clastoptera arizonana TaxID=38151 RepID=A0A1B6BX05_9HEMI